MKTYLKLLKRKFYFGFLVILSCACLGSIRGALYESNDYIGVTQDDLDIMQQPDHSAPDLIGIFPLASEQNGWHNFSYAVIYAKRGFIIYCILMACYSLIYDFRFFKWVRRFIGENENILFINTDYDV